jgi:hypothetical protein
LHVKWWVYYPDSGKKSRVRSSKVYFYPESK